jgi:hypothetical protein
MDELTKNLQEHASATLGNYSELKHPKPVSESAKATCNSQKEAGKLSSPYFHEQEKRRLQREKVAPKKPDNKFKPMKPLKPLKPVKPKLPTK